MLCCPSVPYLCDKWPGLDVFLDVPCVLHLVGTRWCLFLVYLRGIVYYVRFEGKIGIEFCAMWPFSRACFSSDVSMLTFMWQGMVTRGKEINKRGAGVKVQGRKKRFEYRDLMPRDVHVSVPYGCTTYYVRH